MKSLDEYQKLAEIQMGARQSNGEPWPPVGPGYIDTRSVLTVDVTPRMLILAMADFLEEIMKLGRKKSKKYNQLKK